MDESEASPSLRQASRERLLCVVLAGGYLFLLGDTWIEHLDAVKDHPQAWIPRITAVVLCLVLIATMVRWTPTMRKVAVGFLAASALVGLVGFYFHNAERFAEGFNFQHMLFPPLLAPFAFTGQGLLGMVALWPSPPEGTG